MDEILEQMRVHYRVMAECEPISDDVVIRWFREDNLVSWATGVIRTREDMRFETVEPVVRVARQLRDRYEWEMMGGPARCHVIPPEDDFAGPLPIARPVVEQP